MVIVVMNNDPDDLMVEVELNGGMRLMRLVFGAGQMRHNSVY
jgi:hypothetical protein